MMPWEKSFEIDATLDKAAEVFSVKGYEATSVADLVKAMGVNRGSLYATFGNKHDLFKSVLTRFVEERQAQTLAQLEAMDEAQRLACVLPPESLLVGHTRVTLDGDNAARFLSGVRRRGPWPDASAVAVFGDQPAALLGVGHIVGGELVPGRLLSPLEIQQILEGTPHSASMAHSGTLEKL